MKKTNSIKMGAVISYVSIVLNIVSGILYTPWMITKIGQNDYGLYTLAYSLISMFVLDFGMSAAVTRFLSKYLAKGESEKANDFLGLIYKIYIAIDAIIFVILLSVFLNINSIYSNLSYSELQKLEGIFLLVGLFNLISFPFTNLNGILTAHEKFVELKLCDLFNKVTSILLIIIALFNGYGVFTLVFVNVLSGLITIVLKLFIIKRSTQVKVNFKYYNTNVLKEIFGFSMWTTLSGIAQRLIFNITPSIIAIISSTGSVGVAIFGLASTIEGYVFTFANAINGMFMPRISRIVAQEKKDEQLLPLMIKVGRLQIILIGMITMGFILFGKTFIVNIWGKGDFVQSYYCAIALIIPSFFYLPMQIANTTIVVENKVKLQTLVLAIMGGINIIFSFASTKYIGALGASISIFIAYMVRTILMAIIHNNVLHIEMKNFFCNTFVKFFPSFCVIFLIGIIIRRFNFAGNIYLEFFIDLILFILIYLVVLYKFVMNNEEKKLFLGFLKK